MTAQLDLDLFVQQAVEAITKEEEENNALASECARLLFNGKDELVFTFDMKVIDVHHLWDDAHGEKMEAWEARFKPDIDRCLEQLQKLGSRARKERAPIKAELAQLQYRSTMARACIEAHYQTAQEALDQRVHEQWRTKHPDLDDDDEERAHEDFWHTLTEARALEEVAHWTIQDAADIAISWATNPEETDLADNEAFRESYLRARKRADGKLHQTSGEYYMGAGLILRCAIRAGETVIGANGKPLK